MPKIDLPAMANSVRGSGGTIAIPAVTAQALKLQGEPARNGLLLVKCQAFVAAVDAIVAGQPVPLPVYASVPADFTPMSSIMPGIYDTPPVEAGTEKPKPTKRGRGKKPAAV